MEAFASTFLLHFNNFAFLRIFVGEDQCHILPFDLAGNVVFGDLDDQGGQCYHTDQVGEHHKTIEGARKCTAHSFHMTPECCRDKVLRET